MRGEIVFHLARLIGRKWAPTIYTWSYEAPGRGSLCNKLCEFRSLIGGLSLAFLTIGFVILMMATGHVFFWGVGFLMKRNLGLKTYGFSYTHTY